jgi:hypothetical protein
MSNENATKSGPEQLVDKRRAAMREIDPKLTRIPVAHLYFSHGEYLDVPETGMSQLSNIRCYPQPTEQPRYFLCDYIPAWQTFELSFYAGPGEQPKTTMVPVSRVSTWKRA